MAITTIEAKQATRHEKLNAVMRRFGEADTLSWRREVRSDSDFVYHQLIDKKGRVIAADICPDRASEQAYRAFLGKIPSHMQTRIEFADNSIVIPVRTGRGKSGLDESGPEYMMIVNDPGSAGDVALAELRSELRALYTREYGRGAPPESYASQADAFVERSVSGLLARPFTQEISGMRVPGGRNLIFAKEAIINRVANIFAILHGTEVEDALMLGKYVPDCVLRDCPNIVEHAQPYQLTREQYLSYPDKVRSDVGNPNVRKNLHNKELYDAGQEYHFVVVRDALEKHIPVAPEVLADYPTLQSIALGEAQEFESVALDTPSCA